MTQTDLKHFSQSYGYYQSILSMLGVSLWADKTASLTQVPSWQCRLETALADEVLAADGVLVADELVGVQSAKQPSPTLIDHSASTNKPTPTKTPSPSTDEPPLPVVFEPLTILQEVVLTASEFELYGIRYRQWLLLADGAILSTATLGIWQSLAQALANQQQTPYVSLHTRYPLCFDGYEERQEYTKVASLLGFLTRLCAQTPEITALGLLTPLPTGVEIGQTLGQKLIATPTLEMMAQQAQSKKRLWQLLHS